MEFGKDKRYDGKNKEQVKLEYLKESKHAIDNFIEIIDYNKFVFNQSKTVKIHTIESHVLDYIEDNGKTVGCFDQCIEAVHQYFDSRMNSSNYKVKYKTSETAGKKLLQLVLHFNAYNLYN